MKRVAIIGGSGFENPEILKDPERISMNTKYGEPSSSIHAGRINGVEVILISRHGRSHTITPTQVNNRANISAIKELECSHILATTACGSLREEIQRGDLIVPDQFIDFTRFRANTFYGEFDPGEINHTAMADPFDMGMREILINEASSAGIRHHDKGTIITIEGPRFSTRAESRMFRTWGADIVNMSTAPEAILANELGIPYAVIAMSTDYDTWKDDEEAVTWKAIQETFKQNVSNVVSLIERALAKL